MNRMGELIVSSIVFIVSFILYGVATTFPNYKQSDQVGPALWPKMLLLAILFLSGFLVIKYACRVFRDASSAKDKPSFWDHSGNRMLILTIMLSLLYGFGVSHVGFLLSIFLFQLVFLMILKVRALPTLILYPIGLTAVVYAIFIKLLYIPLPRGTGIFLTFSRLFY